MSNKQIAFYSNATNELQDACEFQVEYRKHKN